MSWQFCLLTLQGKLIICWIIFLQLLNLTTKNDHKIVIFAPVYLLQHGYIHFIHNGLHQNNYLICSNIFHPPFGTTTEHILKDLFTNLQNNKALHKLSFFIYTTISTWLVGASGLWMIAPNKTLLLLLLFLVSFITWYMIIMIILVNL